MASDDAAIGVEPDRIVPVPERQYRELFEQRIAGRMFSRLTAIGVSVLVIAAGGIYTVIDRLTSARLSSFEDTLDDFNTTLDGLDEVVAAAVGMRLAADLPTAVEGAVNEAVTFEQMERAVALFTDALQRPEFRNEFANAAAEEAVTALVNDPDKVSELLAVVLRENVHDPEVLKLYAAVERDAHRRRETLEQLILSLDPRQTTTDWDVLAAALPRFLESDLALDQPLGREEVTAWLAMLISQPGTPPLSGSPSMVAAREAVTSFFAAGTRADLGMLDGLLVADNPNYFVIGASLAQAGGGVGVRLLSEFLERTPANEATCIVLGSLYASDIAERAIDLSTRLELFEGLWNATADQFVPADCIVPVRDIGYDFDRVEFDYLAFNVLASLIRPSIADWSAVVLPLLTDEVATNSRDTQLLGTWIGVLPDLVTNDPPNYEAADATALYLAERFFAADQMSSNYEQLLARLVPLVSEQTLAILFARYPDYYVAATAGTGNDPDVALLAALGAREAAAMEPYHWFRSTLATASPRFEGHLLRALAGIPNDEVVGPATLAPVAGERAMRWQDYNNAVILAEAIARRASLYGVDEAGITAVGQSNLVPSLSAQGYEALAIDLEHAFMPWLAERPVPGATLTPGDAGFAQTQLALPEAGEAWIEVTLNAARSYQWTIAAAPGTGPIEQRDIATLLLDSSLRRSIAAGARYRDSIRSTPGNQTAFLRIANVAAGRLADLCVEELRSSLVYGTTKATPVSISPEVEGGCHLRTSYTIGSQQDDEWMTMFVTAGETYVMSTVVRNGADSDIAVYYADTPDVQVAYNDDTVGRASLLEFRPDRDGVVLIRVGHWGAARGEFDFSIARRIAG